MVGREQSPHDGLLGILERFVSPISARAMLRAAVSKAERATGEASLLAVLQQLELSTNILILPSQREEALTALRSLVPSATPTATVSGSGSISTGTSTSPATPSAATPAAGPRPIEPSKDEPTTEESVATVRKESDLNYTRMLAREACNLVGVRGYQAQKVVTAVSELARNIARYVGDGKVRFRIDTESQRLIIVAEDKGPGISNLDDVMTGNYRSKTGLGRGLMGVRNLADEFDIDTGPHGTTIRIAFRYA
jgi:serine/threonine-protein kinase RsbT